MSPVTGLRLLLPAIVPSWRFFDAVTASPRLDYALLAAPGDPPAWQEFRPRREVLTFAAMLRRLLWNAQSNENLFLVSLSERLITATSAETAAHSQRELLLRVARHLDRQRAAAPRALLQIRLRLVSRMGPGDAVDSELVYLSAPCPLADLVTP
ncbi:MAG: hypothetical protein QM756_20385 [Polyangiaceae bacterium]